MAASEEPELAERAARGARLPGFTEHFLLRKNGGPAEHSGTTKDRRQERAAREMETR